MLSSANVETIILCCGTNHFFAVNHLLETGLKKMDKNKVEADEFGWHKEQVKATVNTLVNNKSIKSAVKPVDEHGEERKVSIFTFLNEHLPDTNASFVVLEDIKKCVNSIQKYIDYNNELNFPERLKAQPKKTETVQVLFQPKKAEKQPLVEAKELENISCCSLQ